MSDGYIIELYEYEGEEKSDWEIVAIRNVVASSQKELKKIISTLSDNYRIVSVDRKDETTTGEEFIKEIKEKNKPKGMEYGKNDNK